MRKIAMMLFIVLVFSSVFVGSAAGQSEVTAQDVETIISLDQYSRLDQVVLWLENNNPEEYPDLYERAEEWSNNSNEADQYNNIDGLNDDLDGSYNRVVASVSDGLSVVDYGYRDGNTYIVLESEGKRDIQIGYAEQKDLFRQSFSVDDGLTEVIINGQKDQVNVWDGNVGKIVSGGGGLNLYESVVQDPSYRTLYIVTVSSIIFTLLGLMLWVLRQEYINKTVINEVTYGRDSYKLQNTDTKYEALLRYLGILWSVKYVVITVGIIGGVFYFLDPNIPNWMYISAVSGVIVLPLTYVIAPRVDNYINLLSEEFDLYISTNPEIEDQDVPFMSYEISSSSTNHIEVRGESRTFNLNGRTVHICDYFDPKEQVGYAGDYTSVPEELWYSVKEAAYESRKRRNTLKQYAQNMRREINNVVNEVSLSYHNKLAEKEAEMYNFEGEDINDIVRDRLTSYDDLMSSDEVYLDSELRDRMDERSKNDGDNNKADESDNKGDDGD